MSVAVCICTLMTYSIQEFQEQEHLSLLISLFPESYLQNEQQKNLVYNQILRLGMFSIIFLLISYPPPSWNTILKYTR